MAMTNERKWRQDPDAEVILKEIAGVAFSLDIVSFDDIDWVESANNCARLKDPINDEKVEDYITCMNRGDVFPMIVVERTKKGKYTILGGNQRASALKKIESSAVVECYVVDPLVPDERELIIRSLNSRHGWGTTKEDRIEHAVYLVRKHGMHVETVARAMVVSTDTIRNRIRAEDERARLAKNGIDSSSMPLRSLYTLSSIADESARNETAKAALEMKATGDKVAEVAAIVGKAKSRAAAAKAIADFKKAESVTKQIVANPKSKLKKPRREKLLHSLTSLADFLDRGNDGQSFSSLEEFGCSVDHDLDNVRLLAAKINARLQCICEAGQ